MIDLYNGLTPNVLKVTIFLEEAGLPYRNIFIDLSLAQQFRPEFLAISPNARIPTIVDHEPADGGAPFAVFESGAILQYLAEKTGKFLPRGMRERSECMQWVFWQMAGLGPMSGQTAHFLRYAKKLDPNTDHRYARVRYITEVNRLYGVLDHRLRGRDFIVSEYSIADMICYPWVALAELMKQDLAEFPDLKRWLSMMAGRPAVKRAYERNTKENREFAGSEDDLHKSFFGRSAKAMYSK